MPCTLLHIYLNVYVYCKQTLNKQQQSQCFQLSSALRSLTVENEKQQASLKVLHTHTHTHWSCFHDFWGHCIDLHSFPVDLRYGTYFLSSYCRRVPTMWLCYEVFVLTMWINAHTPAQTDRHSMTLSSLCFFQAERSCVFNQLQERDLLLEAARRNIQTELQVALTDKVSLQLELWVSYA